MTGAAPLALVRRVVLPVFAGLAATLLARAWLPGG
jgi:hypothetical protein